jgi:cell division protein FtsZ
MIEFAIEQEMKSKPIARIKVFGIGGAGCNTINSVIGDNQADIEFIALNTDVQALENSRATSTLHIGAKSTRGIGTGANPELGQRAAEEDMEKIQECFIDTDVVFLTGGLGGGTGSGALPVIARSLKERNILSIAVVTKPFLFEGKRRQDVASKALEELKQEVDTLIVIPNQKLLGFADKQVSLVNGFQMINDIVSQFVKGVADIITQPGHINVDFADVKAIMKDMGLAVMVTGRASGPDRAEQAMREAISSQLLENMNIKGAQGVLLNIAGNNELGLHEVSAAASIIYEQVDENASIVLGSVIDSSLQDEVIVTIIATGCTPQDQYESVEQKQHEEKTENLDNGAVHGSVHVAESNRNHDEQEQHKKKRDDQYIYQHTQDELEIPAALRRQNKQKEQ